MKLFKVGAYALNEKSLWTKLLYKPLINLLFLFYFYLPGRDLGIAIIALTLLVRIILFPSFMSTLKSQRAMQKLQPEFDRVKREFKDDKEQQSKELMKLYKTHKVNPLGSCLPLIIQLPILWTLYRVFVLGLSDDSLKYLYDFFPKAGATINTTFLHFTGISWLMVDLSKPSLALALLAGVMQLLQSVLNARFTPQSGGKGMGKMISTQMIYFFPIITVFIAMSLPSALALYWVAMTFLTALQQFYVLKFVKEKDESANPG